MLLKNLFLSFLMVQSFTLTFDVRESEAWNAGGGCVRFLRSMLDVAKDNLTKDYSGRVLELDQGNKVILSPRLGSGVSSSVYEVLEFDGKVPDQKLIIKINHRWRSTGRVIPFSTKQLHLESDSYHLKDIYHVPVVPIESRVSFEGAPALMKPFLRGTPLKKLVIEAKHAKNLTEVQKQKLHDLYEIQKKIFADKKIWIDLNTTNMTWVSDPVELKALGLLEPTMVLYELSGGPNMSHIYPKNHTFDDFLKFLDNIK